MDSFLNKAGRKLFEQHLQQYQPQDPLYETYVDKRGRTKRRRREVPPGLSSHDIKVLKSVQRRAHYLDKGFRVLGMRFGYTFIIGLVPVVGDCADAALNYLLVVRKAQQADIPDWLLSRMLANNAVSLAAGFLPFAGDIVLAAYKANSRNAALLEEYLRVRGEQFLKVQSERPANGKAQERAAGGGAISTSVAAKAGGLHPNDANAIKPGAGRQAGEVVPGEEAMGSRRRWWGSGKAKGRPLKKPSQGRFVEDVDGNNGVVVPSGAV